MVSRENKNNAYAKFGGGGGGANKEYYGIFRVAYDPHTRGRRFPSDKRLGIRASLLLTITVLL